jgi:site-specific recombinase XerD
MVITEGKSQKRELMDAGFLAPWIAEFGSSLEALEHSSLTVRGYTDSARHFAAWICHTGLQLDEIGTETVGSFARHHCRCAGGRRWNGVSGKYARRAGRFVAFLAERRVVPAAPPVAAEIIHPHIQNYQRWLAVHRGLSERSISRQVRLIKRLLPALGKEPRAYDAAKIRAVVQAEAQRCSPSHTRTMTSALRGFLSFLAASGLCRPGLDQAVPPVVQWRLSALPRYLPTADVERLIASCDLATPCDLRDRAVLLLLARLGLRAGDVCGLRLEDFDWSAGAVRVCGKSRCSVRLPLPQDVGDAVLAYIENGRPTAAVAVDRLFLRSKAPYRPLRTSSSISYIVARALRRAGVADPPSKGAGLLRHSAATTMLRAGATLEAVGAILRHRSPDMTAHYAKVDVTMLATIAQPWPGEASC